MACGTALLGVICSLDALCSTRMRRCWCGCTRTAPLLSGNPLGVTGFVFPRSLTGFGVLVPLGRNGKKYKAEGISFFNEKNSLQERKTVSFFEVPHQGEQAMA